MMPILFRGTKMSNVYQLNTNPSAMLLPHVLDGVCIDQVFLDTYNLYYLNNSDEPSITALDHITHIMKTMPLSHNGEFSLREKYVHFKKYPTSFVQSFIYQNDLDNGFKEVATFNNTVILAEFLMPVKSVDIDTTPLDMSAIFNWFEASGVVPSLARNDKPEEVVAHLNQSIKHILEEVDELLHAVDKGPVNCEIKSDEIALTIDVDIKIESDKELAEALDAATDIAWVCMQFMYNIFGNKSTNFIKTVVDANWEKFRDGVIIKDRKIQKPEGWVKPDKKQLGIVSGLANKLNT